MFKHILVPTDGSELSERAAKAAVLLAKSLGAKVTGFFAQNGYPISAYAEYIRHEFGTLERSREFERARAAGYLSFIKDLADAEGVSCSTESFASPLPYEGILKVAKDKGCDLIVMASHGRRGVSALVLGSETNKVVTHAALPVLVYH